MKRVFVVSMKVHVEVAGVPLEARKFLYNVYTLSMSYRDHAVEAILSLLGLEVKGRREDFMKKYCIVSKSPFLSDEETQSTYYTIFHSM
jgi:hypothetical protein